MVRKRSKRKRSASKRLKPLSPGMRRDKVTNRPISAKTYRARYGSPGGSRRCRKGAKRRKGSKCKTYKTVCDARTGKYKKCKRKRRRSRSPSRSGSRGVRCRKGARDPVCKSGKFYRTRCRKTDPWLRLCRSPVSQKHLGKMSKREIKKATNDVQKAIKKIEKVAKKQQKELMKANKFYAEERKRSPVLKKITRRNEDAIMRALQGLQKRGGPNIFKLKKD